MSLLTDGRGMGLARFLLLAAVVALLSSSAGALLRPDAGAGPRSSAPAIDWLTKAVRAPGRVSYYATETVVTQDERGTHRHKARVVHRVPDDTRREYLSDQGEVEKVVSDDGHLRWQHLPKQSKIIFSPSLRSDREPWGDQPLNRLLGNYLVELAGKETISARQAQVLAIRPRPGHLGPSKRLWLDETTGLILQSELTSTDGKTRSLSTLSELRLAKTVPSREFTPPANARKQTVISQHVAVLPLPALARHWKRPLLTPTRIPPGYSLESARLLRRGRHSFVHLRYVDGVNALSLFEAPSGQPRGSAPSRPAGDRVIKGSPAVWRLDPPFRSLSWREHGLKLTLVGDLPRMELLAIAQASALWRAEASPPRTR